MWNAGLRIILPVVVGLGLVAGPAGAQQDSVAVSEPADTLGVVPVDTVPEPEPDRWAATADLGFTGASGNTRLAVLATGFKIEHLQKDNFELEWRVAFRYGESRGEVVARSVATSFSFDLQPEASVSPFIFGTAERDPFRRMALRSDGGAGAKFTLSRGDAGTASLSAAALYRYESLTGEDASHSATRWSLRTSATRKLGSTLSVENMTYYRPVWDDATDFDVHATTRLKSRISDRLALTLTHEYLHDATPPLGVAREDQRFQAGLTIEF